jgi:hypothetical protein
LTKPPTREAFAAVVRSRPERGLSFIKFDLSARMFEQVPGASVGSDTRYECSQFRQFHMTRRGAGARISERGLVLVRDICCAVREEVCHEVSLCTDHFGEGFVTMPVAPGLGIGLNEDVIREHLVSWSGYFELSDKWDAERVGFLGHLVW